MFNKEYPKSCTMFDTGFERSYKTPFLKKKRFVGTGTWASIHLAGIFYTDVDSFSTKTYMLGFRGNIYVQ
jgi:hypothetical protein